MNYNVMNEIREKLYNEQLKRMHDARTCNNLSEKQNQNNANNKKN